MPHDVALHKSLVSRGFCGKGQARTITATTKKRAGKLIVCAQETGKADCYLLLAAGREAVEPTDCGGAKNLRYG